MLNNSKLIGFLATRNPGRTRELYERTLGLTFVSDDRFALVFEANGTASEPLQRRLSYKKLKIADFSELTATVLTSRISREGIPGGRATTPISDIEGKAVRDPEGQARGS
jgi:hypothetical protein